MVRKKYRQVIWRWKYTTNHCQGGKNYIGKKRKDQPCHTNWKKKFKRHAIGWSKEKNTVRAAKLQCKKCSVLSRAK